MMKLIKQGSVGELVMQGFLIAAVVAFATPDIAWAQQGVGRMAETLTDEINPFTRLIAGGSYLAAALAGVAGAYKLKAHAENPSQTPMSHGLVRLGIAGGLASLPTLLNYANKSMFDSNEGIQFQPLNTIN